MSRSMPNTGNFFVFDIDAKTSVGWLIRDFQMRRLHAGRIDGSLRAPKVDVRHEYRIWTESEGGGRAVVSRDFIKQLAEESVDYFFVEPAHIKPQVLSFSQPFYAEEIDAFYAACKEFRIVPLGLHFSMARYSLKASGTRKQSMGDKRPWHALNTDAGCLATYLAQLPNFNNFLRLRPMSDKEITRNRDRVAEMTKFREETQDLINELRFEATELPPWAQPVPQVPEKVTHTIAAIVFRHPEWTWKQVARAYEFHGRAASGRGRSSLARAQVAHQQGSDSFVRTYGWAGVRWEFDRIRCSYWHIEFLVPFPKPLPERDGRRIDVYEPQMSLFELGMSTPSYDGNPELSEESAEASEGQAATDIRRQSRTPLRLLEHLESRPENTAIERPCSTDAECIDLESA